MNSFFNSGGQIMWVLFHKFRITTKLKVPFGFCILISDIKIGINYETILMIGCEDWSCCWAFFQG